jgi:Uma2 family endonuclease
MGMPAPQANWTAEMARALPDDGQRYEVLDGELHVSPAPTLEHQSIVQRLFRLIDPYVSGHELGWTWLSPADIEFSPKRLLQPDLFVVPDRGRGEPLAWRDITELLLVVEVGSPSTLHVDRGEKRRIYLSEEIPEYWIVNAERRLVERWQPKSVNPETISNELLWQPSDKQAPLRIVVPRLFSNVRP